MKLKGFLIFISVLLVLGWMYVIFSFSNQKAVDSKSTSELVLYKVVEIAKGRNLSINEKKALRLRYLKYVRKLAHFSLYFVLGIFIYIFLCFLTRKQKLQVFLAILLCFLYACSDEFHQIYVPGRCGRFLDVMIDTSGSMIAISLVLLFRSFVCLNCMYYLKENNLD